MADDWRVTVSFSDAARAREAARALRGHQPGDDVRDRLGGSVAISADGPAVFLYAATEEAAREADRVVREILARHRLTAAGFALDRWHPDEEEWEDASVPLPASDQDRAAEHQRLIDYETGQSAAGQAAWAVRVELSSHRQAVELAGRLRAEGRPVIRRWKYLLLGAANEDEASALAATVAQQAPADAVIRTEGNPFVPFDIRQPGTGGVPNSRAG
jgi:hypothetical protein